MNRGSSARTAHACCAGIVNRAVIANVTAILFVPLMQVYGWSYGQAGLLTAVGFAAQTLADVALLFLIDRAPCKLLALLACGVSCAGLLFYGAVPLFFAPDAVFAGIAAATAVFAFAGGMLEVILSNVAERLPARSGDLFLLHTVYAWAQVAVSLLLLASLSLFGAKHWNPALFALAAAPVAAGAMIARSEFPPRTPARPARASFRPFYLLAVGAVFFGYGAEVVMNQWISAFAADVFGFAAGGTLGCALFALCLGVGGAFYFALLRRRGTLPLSVLAAAALLSAGAYALAALVSVPALALACAAACGLFVGVLSPGAMTAAGEALPHAGGWMLASLAVAQDVGAAVLPAAAGAVSDVSSLQTAFLVSAAVPLLAALFLFFMHRARRAGQGRG